MKNYYIIHGFMGSNIENWFPWFKEQIDSDNTLCVIPQFPIEVDKHNYNEWKKLLDVYYKDFNMINNGSVIIGHSTGSICALKYVLENKIKIDKLILVSGFNNYLAPDENDIHNKINPTYYVDENCTQLTTLENSGAANDGEKPKDAGTYWVKAAIEADGNYASKEVTKSFTIKPKTVTATVTLAEKTYDKTRNAKAS